MLTDSAKILIDLIIGNTNDLQPIAFQKSGMLSITFDVSAFVVLGTIQFDNQFCFRTVEIYDTLA